METSKFMGVVVWGLQSGEVTREKTCTMRSMCTVRYPLAEIVGLSWRARSGPTWYFHITRKM